MPSTNEGELPQIDVDEFTERPRKRILSHKETSSRPAPIEDESRGEGAHVDLRSCCLVLRPGDSLIIRLPSNTSHERIDKALCHVKASLPGINPCVIVADQILVYRDREVREHAW